MFENLHLTGSRFFGNATSESDYDYFIEDSEELRTVLVADGWKNMTPLHIHPLANTLGVFVKGNIHLQLVKDVKLKSDIQTAIVRADLSECLKDKKLARRIWLFAYVLCRLRMCNGVTLK